MATALAIAQEVARRMGIAVPSSLVSTDTDGVQMLALLNEVGEELTTRFRWQQLTQEASWTTVASEAQGSLSSIFGNGVDSVVSLTIWDSTDQRFIDGPLTDQAFLQTRTLVQGPEHEYKIFANRLYILPQIESGHQLQIFYRSSKWVLASDSVTYKEFLTADDDTPLYPDALMKLGLRWKWREEKGLPYAEVHRSFEAMAADTTARNQTGRLLYMSDSVPRLVPGVFVKAGNTIPT